ncbi:MAG TPA: prolyl aminopeptidase [Propionibacteriaceae bacterium]|nr:prolyl aminopeptidase [Propionibacteriaceae bacterium]
MALPYPPIEPFEHSWLDVGDGQHLYWEQCGNPDGKPALVLHGGPGSGCTPYMRQMFDPGAYRIILVDQRGAGRSQPHASTPAADLAINTTQHLINDLELLMERVRVQRWLLYGISWGSTLGLAYAEAYPERVSEIILAPVTVMQPSGVDWFTRGAARFFPCEWEIFCRGVPEASRDGNLAAAYANLLNDPDPSVHEPAARAWCAWEEALVSIESGGVPNPRYNDPRFRLGFARLVSHYFAHAAWLGETELLDNAHRLTGIPGVLVHGRLDIGGPLITAWQLKRAWPGSELIVVDHAGHTSGGLIEHVVEATDRFI